MPQNVTMTDSKLTEISKEKEQEKVIFNFVSLIRRHRRCSSAKCGDSRTSPTASETWQHITKVR